jgi:tryptophan synthase alpha chain
MTREDDRIARAVRKANAEGRPALVAFLTAGFPRKEEFTRHLQAVSKAADVVEIGVPFSDPMADGATIQRSSEKALEEGVALDWILATIAALDPKPASPLLLMSYLNPLLAFGLSRLPAAAREAGVGGFIAPDLPFEESAEFKEALRREGLALIQMAAPTTPPERLAKICSGAEGFVYAVAMLGSTGGEAAMSDAFFEYLDRVRRASPVPVCAGFGIRSAEQIKKIAAHADGVVVGSALVEAIERGEDPAAMLCAWRSL